jgi:ribose transport system permease protein
MADAKTKGGKALITMSRTQKQLFSTFSALFLLALVFSVWPNSNFFTLNNLLTVATQGAVIAIIAIGQTYVLITGGIDLAIGSVLALSAMISGLAMQAGIPVPIAVIMGLFTGVFCGAFSGVLVAYANIPPFIATLGTMTIARGVALTLTGGYPVSNLPKSFTMWGTSGLFQSDRFQGIGYPFIIMLVLVLCFGFILAKTSLGRHVYATGSNFEAARLSGVNTKHVLVAVYVFSGFLAAFAGLIVAARIISAMPSAGDAYELDAVASSVIGGTSTMGGEGSAAGTFIGAYIIQILRNGLNLIGVSPFIQKITIGIVIVASVFFDRVRRKD